MKYKNISIIGLGYIGLPTAAIFASKGAKVFGLDINKNIVNTINKGQIHILEPGLDAIISIVTKNKFLVASLNAKISDAFIIAVPTPLHKKTKNPNINHIMSACKLITNVIKKGDLIVLESTSPVGTTEKVSEFFAKNRKDLTFPHTHGDHSDIRIAYCPERVLPGNIMEELVYNDRIIGGISNRCSLEASKLYKIFAKGQMIHTNSKTAEMSKLTENSFRDVNIAFANELSLICDKQNIDVWELIDLSNRHPRVNILNPGPGVGGHCIAVDPWFIVSQHSKESKLIKTAREVNNFKPKWTLNKIKNLYNKIEKKDAKICILGIAFKPNIDDLRESPALYIANKLSKIYRDRLLVAEPNIKNLPQSLDKNNSKLVKLSYARNNSDLLVILVAHKEFKNLKKFKGLILDFTNLQEGTKKVN